MLTPDQIIAAVALLAAGMGLGAVLCGAYMRSKRDEPAPIMDDDADDDMHGFASTRFVR